MGINQYQRFVFSCLVAIGYLFVLTGNAFAAGGDLTVKRVILSAGGVGYFELEAEITGDAEVSFSVPLNQVDDILKSLVIADSGGGSASVTTAGRRPLQQIFQDYPFRAGDLSSPAALLNRLRGARIKVAGPVNLEGRVLRVVKETRRLPDGDGTVVRHRATVMTDGGLRQFIVEDANGIDFLDNDLKQQLADATSQLAEHSRRDRRDIIIQSTGNGTRTLQLGYVVAVPLWKSTYRLVLPAKGDQARLQGWAVIENLSGMDWQNVELSVVSGNPVTFRQALYKPYFVNRPRVPIETAGRVLPPPDSGTLRNRKKRFSKTKDEALGRRAEKKSRSRRGGLAGALSKLSAPMSMADTEVAEREPPKMVSAANTTASDSATQVAFTFKGKQTIGSGFTAMLPIIDRLIPAARVSHYQPRTHRTRPLASVRLKNDGESGLPPGILTLFEMDNIGKRDFIGDARIKAFPAGESRLLSFAVDHKSRITTRRKGSEEITKITANAGVLKISLMQEATTVYQIDAPKIESRRFIIEQPKRAGWKLKQPVKSDSETPGAYRFNLMLEADGSKTLPIVLHRTRAQHIAIARLSSRQLVAYFKNGKIGDEAKAALQRIADLRQSVEVAKQQLAKIKARRGRITKEQNRIRANMRSIARTSNLYGRYVKKLNAQENQMEDLTERGDAARKLLEDAQRDLSSFIRAVKF